MKRIVLLLCILGINSQIILSQENEIGNVHRVQLSYSPPSGENGFVFNQITFSYQFGTCPGALAVAGGIQNKSLTASAYMQDGVKYTSRELEQSLFTNINLNQVDVDAKAYYNSQLVNSDIVFWGIQNLNWGCWGDTRAVIYDWDKKTNINNYRLRDIEISKLSSIGPGRDKIVKAIQVYEAQKKLDEAENLIISGNTEEARSKIYEAKRNDNSLKTEKRSSELKDRIVKLEEEQANNAAQSGTSTGNKGIRRINTGNINTASRPQTMDPRTWYQNQLSQIASMEQQRQLAVSQMEAAVERIFNYQSSYDIIRSQTISTNSDDPREILRQQQQSIRTIKFESERLLSESYQKFREASNRANQTAEQAINNLTDMISAAVEQAQIRKERERKLKELEEEKRSAFDRIKYNLEFEYKKGKTNFGKEAALALNKSEQDYNYLLFEFYDCSLNSLERSFSYNNTNWTNNYCDYPNSPSSQSKTFPDKDNPNELIQFAKEKSEYVTKREYGEIYQASALKLVELAEETAPGNQTYFLAQKSQVSKDPLQSFSYALKAYEMDNSSYENLYKKADKTLLYALLSYIREENTNKLREITRLDLEKGKVINISGVKYTPLFYAVKYDKVESYKVLARKQSNLDKDQVYLSAILENSPKIIRHILRPSYNPKTINNKSPLVLSLINSNDLTTTAITVKTNEAVIDRALSELENSRNNANKLLPILFEFSPIEDERINQIANKYGLANDNLLEEENKRLTKLNRIKRRSNRYSKIREKSNTVMYNFDSNSSVGLSIVSTNRNRFGWGVKIQFAPQIISSGLTFQGSGEPTDKFGDRQYDSSWTYSFIEKKTVDFELLVEVNRQLDRTVPLWPYIGFGFRAVSEYSTYEEEFRKYGRSYNDIREQEFTQGLYRTNQTYGLVGDLGVNYIINNIFAVKIGYSLLNEKSLEFGIGISY